MGGICIRCGAPKADLFPSSTSTLPDQHPNFHSTVALTYIHHGLEISHAEAERLRRGTSEHVLANRKLLLILDLDHTLLNSTRLIEVPPDMQPKLQEILDTQSPNKPDLFRFPYMGMWTKFRPGVREFLNQAKTDFDLHVYTMGDKHYAAEMAKILDPEGTLFHGKVISSWDSTKRHVKDLDVVLGHDDDVLIVDDTEGVWPRHRENLLQIERYTYFPADAERFGTKKSLAINGEDESVENGALKTILNVLQQVHKRFFDAIDDADRDVRLHLHAIKAAVLGPQVVVLFSRIFPKDTATDPSTHPLWRVAVRLGARCVMDMQEDDVTHVVAAMGTEKTKWGQKCGKYVVSPDWLWACAYSWRRAEEKEYPVPSSSSVSLLSSSSGAVEGGVVVARTEEEDLAAAIAAAAGGSSSPATNDDDDGGELTLGGSAQLLP
jgi:RNA polymerase II C-terminal domain phosphatase-like 3/4